MNNTKTNLELLTVVTCLDAYVFENGDIVLTTKFIEGIKAYVSGWVGTVRVLLQQTEKEADNLDNQRVNPMQLSFETAVIDFLSAEMNEQLRGSSIVITAVGHRQNHISKICKEMKIPCLYITEYSLRARLQSLYYNTKNPLRFIRGVLWSINQEHKQRQAIALAQGLQANGTPTHDAYRQLTPNPLLYFDNRIQNSDLISLEQLSCRLNRLNEKKPLRLAFSGRLIRMKGADHIIPLCLELERLSLAYTMTIYGSGNQEKKIREQITHHRLSKHVKMVGALDFRSKLLPSLKNSIDLFVCCHVQGDPSCTYVETFACGLPIVGYNNEAFQGILNHTEYNLGYSVAIGDSKALAKKIQQLDNNRELLSTISFHALYFASEHSFEKTFGRRIAHMKKIAAHQL